MNEKTIRASRLDALKGRTAHCPYCYGETPSSEGLAFFEYTGPGSREAEHSCKHCRYFDTAHDPEHVHRFTRNARTVVERGLCEGFEAAGALDHDRFYCGCRGYN